MLNEKKKLVEWCYENTTRGALSNRAAQLGLTHAFCMGAVAVLEEIAKVGKKDPLAIMERCTELFAECQAMSKNSVHLN